MDYGKIIASLPYILECEQMEVPEKFAGKVSLYRICYESDSCRVMGYISIPLEFDGELPVIIYNRGGNRDFGALQPAAVCRYAAYGAVCLGSQYRGNMGGTGLEQFGGDDVNDVIRLIDIGLSIPFSVKSGVYMIGHSRGGMMTYRACAIDDRIKAAVVGAGVSDCFIMYESREDEMKQVFHELVGGGPDDKYDEFVFRSATYWAYKIKPPMLLCQGTNDWRVVPEQTYKMYDKLKEAGKDVELIIYEGAEHDLRPTSFGDDAVKWLFEHKL
ncbi:MAG: prolyl oligopeptidase family serine peptidase [Clostridia bacterium]|nr:prolyl oligopeptidase family serine peptidase [Clostridia bacterium]